MSKSVKILLAVGAVALVVFIVCISLLLVQSKKPTWQEQYDLGIRYLSERNYEEAIIAFNAAIEIDPKRAEAYIGLADVYMVQGDTERTRRVLEDALTVVDDLDAIRSRLDWLEESVTPESMPETSLEMTPGTTPGTEQETTPESTPGFVSSEFIASGSCGENATWALDSDGTLTISGTGPMIPSDQFFPWYDIASTITTVNIENGITSIGYWAFALCYNLTEVTIPNSVTSIEEAAFLSCNSLESVTIPDSVTNIEESAFYSCSNLKSVIIPDGVTNIGDSVFWDCVSLENVSIPSSVTRIEAFAFYDCFSLANVIIPDNVTSIGDSAFMFCSSLESVNIPNRITSIADHAFYGCASLTNVIIPYGVTSIESQAFYFCEQLTSVTIPDSVTRIGEDAFYYVLKDAYYSGSEEQWSEITIEDDNVHLLQANIHYNS